MHVEDLDISPSKIGETAQRIVDRATAAVTRRSGALTPGLHPLGTPLSFVRPATCSTFTSPAVGHF